MVCLPEGYNRLLKDKGIFLRGGNLLKSISFFLFIPLVMFAAFDSADAEEIVVNGTVKSASDVTMMAKTHGTIGRILIKEGEPVKKADVILEIDNQREKASVDLANARLSNARASLREVEVVLENSRKDLKRKEIMKDVIAPKEYENARDLVMQHESVLVAKQAEVKQAEAEVKFREAEFENTLVRAPLDGMISWIYIKEGETIEALRTPLCDISSLNNLYVQVALPIDFVRVMGKKMTIYVELNEETLQAKKRLHGEIIHVSPVMDASSKTFKARIRIISQDKMVRPGMVASVIFSIPGMHQ